jgi:hypothetical protein
MDIPATFRRAVAKFNPRAQQTGDRQWQAATPDEDSAIADPASSGGARRSPLTT